MNDCTRTTKVNQKCAKETGIYGNPNCGKVQTQGRMHVKNSYLSSSHSFCFNLKKLIVVKQT